jgi:hypothetical protein
MIPVQASDEVSNDFTASNAPYLGGSARHFSLVAGLLGALCLAWSCFVDLHCGAGEVIRALAGMFCLWAPVGAVVYLALGSCGLSGVSRFTLSWAISYGLTTAGYAACGALGVVLPGAIYLFYLTQLTLSGAALAWTWRRGLLRRAAWAEFDWLRIDGVLLLLVALSVLIGDRYKAYERVLPDGRHQLVAHGDATYLASLSHELARQTPPLEQPARAGLKERAYHMFPHITTMLIARYAGLPDMLRALHYYGFAVVEVLLCLIFFCIGQGLTNSRWAGYLSCALVYILAIPLTPVIGNQINYFYFTWYTHATSGLEPSLLCSPQMYTALPVVMGVLLLLLELSVRLSRRQSAGTLAILTAVLAAVVMRFRIQAFLILFPGVMLYLTFMWYHSRQRVLGAAIAIGALCVGAQVWEMRLDLYYPDSARLSIENNMLAHHCPFMTAWPGGETVRVWLQESLSPEGYVVAWQAAGLTGFALLMIAGIPVTLVSLFHFARPASWRADTWGLTALVAWLTGVTLVGGTCLCTTYDMYSVGGQALYLVGWYLLPLFAVGLWQIALLLPRRLAPPRPVSLAAFVFLLAGAVGWQVTRPPSQLQAAMLEAPLLFPDWEWQGFLNMRENLPADAVILSKTDHLPGNSCIFSAVTGRRAFYEYLCMSRFLTGGLEDNNEGREARINRVWNADNLDEFVAAVNDTHSTHLVEYYYRPLRVHPSEALEVFWSSANGEMKIWTFRGKPHVSPPERLASSKANGY